MASLTPALLRPAPPDLLAHVTQRESSLLQEFAFSPAHDNPNQRAAQAAAAAEAGDGEAHIGDHVFELRSYRLKPGSMLEWEAHWRKGIEARRRFVVRAPSLSPRVLCRKTRSRSDHQCAPRADLTSIDFAYDRSPPAPGSRRSARSTRFTTSGRSPRLRLARSFATGPGPSRAGPTQFAKRSNSPKA